MTKLRHPVMLVIMDGWGYGDPADPYNAPATAGIHHVREWLQKYPHAQLITCGEKVGLPEGQMGNSEVGHLNIGAGRIIYQELTRINKDIREGAFAERPVLHDLLTKIAARQSTLHVMGLLSPGGVHSHQEHMLAIVRAAKDAGITKVQIHAFLDGRDVPPQSAGEYLRDVESQLHEIGVGRIADISGRYYAMDRDKRWERTRLAYEAVVHGQGLQASDAATALQEAYARGETDEFVLPTVIGEPESIQPGDGGVFFNFRPDRARQLTAALTLADFDGFERDLPQDFELITMTRYEADFTAPVIYEKEQPNKVFGEVVSQAGYKQLRIAETEKYAHVTYFFNGGREEPYPGEDRILVPSPKVATYDLQPEMSAYEVTEQLLAALAEDKYDFIILNFANPDMVGHTGVLAAAQVAVRTVDECVAKLWEMMKSKHGYMLVTADHGNCECMLNHETGEPHTAHTTNPVPVFLLGENLANIELKDGILADLAPTLLALGGVEQPAEMTGQSLLKGRLPE